MAGDVSIEITEENEVITVNVQEARDAYQLAVVGGFTGTREEWLAQLNSATAADIAAAIVAAAEKPAPIGADLLGLVDTENGNALAFVTLANLFSALGSILTPQQVRVLAGFADHPTDFTIPGALIAQSDAFFEGLVEFYERAFFDDEAQFNGDAVFNSYAEFSGDTLFDGPVEFSDDTIFGGNLEFGGDTLFDGPVEFSDDTIFGGNVEFGGDILGGLSIDENLLVQGNLECVGGTFVGAVLFGSDAQFDGDATFSGDALFESDADFEGELVVRTYFESQGESFFDDNVTCQGNVTCSGDITADAFVGALPQSTVATLPTPANNQRFRYEVTDANAPTVGAAVASGGAAGAVVRSNGLAWIVQSLVYP